MRDLTMLLVSVPTYTHCTFTWFMVSVLDIFENLSLSVKRERYTSPEDTLGEREEPSERVKVAETQSTLYEV